MIKKLFQKPTIQWPTKFEQKLEIAKDENLIAFYSNKPPARSEERARFRNDGVEPRET